MKRILLAALAAAIAVTGCTQSQVPEESVVEKTVQDITYLCELDNGESVTAEVVIPEGYQFIEGNEFYILNEEGTAFFIGFFLDGESYDEYSNAVRYNDGIGYAEILEEGLKGNNEYIFYTMGEEDTEYQYVLRVEDSEIAVVMGSLISEEYAREGFDMINFRYAEEEE